MRCKDIPWLQDKLNSQLKRHQQCFDGASDMCGIHGGLAILMKETSQLSIYIHCYAHRLNLALEGSLTLVPNFKNALGTIQSLYNFIGGSAKRVASFKDIKVEGELLSLSLKLLRETKWGCTYEATPAVDEQLERIIKMLALVVLDKYRMLRQVPMPMSAWAICSFNPLLPNVPF